MVRYTVVWKREAEDELTTLWRERINRQAISEAADRIDRELAVDPQFKGIAQPDGVRVLFDPPLAVAYQVEAGDRKVIVALVKYIE